MKNAKLIIAASLFLASCYHNSELKSEKGVVVEKSYSPEFNGEGSSVGLSTSGHMIVSDNSIHKQEQFVVVFKCEHGVVFSINRNALYANLEKGDTVNITYYERLNMDNEVKSLDFVNAFKK